MRGSVGDGKALRHDQDLSLGGLVDHIFEYNLRDMTSDPDHLLNILKFRAMTPLSAQLYEGANGMPRHGVWE
jgi:hypothetical protein